MNFLLLNLLLLTGKISFGGGDILIIKSSHSDKTTYAFDDIAFTCSIWLIKGCLDTITDKLKSYGVEICDIKNVKDKEFDEHIKRVNDNDLMYIAVKISDRDDDWYFGYYVNYNMDNVNEYKIFEEKFFGAFVCFDVEIKNGTAEAKRIKDIEKEKNTHVTNEEYITLRIDMSKNSNSLVKERLLVSDSLMRYGSYTTIFLRDEDGCYTIAEMEGSSKITKDSKLILLSNKDNNNDDNVVADEDNQQILQNNINKSDDDDSEDSYYGQKYVNPQIQNSNSENDNSADKTNQQKVILGDEVINDDIQSNNNYDKNCNDIILQSSCFKFEDENALYIIPKDGEFDDKKNQEEIENNSGGSTKNKPKEKSPLERIGELLFNFGSKLRDYLGDMAFFSLLAIVLVIVLVFFIKFCTKLIILIKIAIMKCINKFSSRKLLHASKFA